LTARPGVLYLSPDTPLPQSLIRDRTRLAVLGSAIYLPLPAGPRAGSEAGGRPQLAGWLALGPRLTGEPYSRQDLSFLEAIADQAAVAVERAQVVADLERRLTDLNVLSQVSQAVNFTIAFDDLLELIYAQAAKVLDASNFHIVLRDPQGLAGPGERPRGEATPSQRDDPPGRLYYAFFVERNERIRSAEGRTWPMGQGLASEIIRTGQPILTDDYRIECERRGVRSLGHPYRAWLGVPLNAGASGPAGAMVAAALDPDVTFTQDQLKIFLALADQAASAIEKARLYRETEQRARQLATLNAVAQSLTSTLALKPLLQQIIESAADVLLVDAGSLFLLDEDTGEYVFTAATGPAAPTLLGTRIPPESGIVGAAADSGQPIIVNDAERDPRVFRFTDQNTGFVSHSIMAAPLRVKERILGVIEVVNRRDGRGFDANDQTLLQAFASQAAVSLENARLYTLTDQALAMRVDELSTLQRFDRELNTALDVGKALGITLDWAMRVTHAAAGAAGLVVKEGVLLLAAEGFGSALDAYRETLLPLDEGRLTQAVSTGEIGLLRRAEAGPDALAVRPEAQVRLVVPIRREARTMAVLVLDGDRPDAFSHEQIAFIERLSDHASIAVTNASLFAEVRQANQAKSEFVSLVSHELKTPMTSIKGYADLLASGLSGPITDTQSQFLDTIRTNVERMSSLVSDLTDISRIEAGRMRLDFVAVPLPAVAEDVVHSVAGQLEAKKQTLEVSIAPDLPLVWADQIRLAQVLTNLLSNAYKYTPVGGRVMLRAEAAPNTWDPDGAARVVHVAVQDTGIGISPEDQKHIFSKFFRSEDQAVREVTGTGLGLNIFKNLVELQGGKAWFESEPGVGSTFHFTLPVATGEQKQLRREKTADG
jgi:signal transduction histidine kinase